MADRTRTAGLGARSAVMMAAFATDRLFGFALIMLITRWWSPTSVGHWTQLVALTGAFAVVTSLGLFQAHVRIAAESTDPRVRKSLQLSIVFTTTLAMGVLTLVAMTARHTVARWAFGSAEDATLVLAVCFLATSDLWMEFVTTQFRAQLHTGQTALVVAGKAVMRFVIVAVFAVRHEGGLSTIVALLAAVQADDRPAVAAGLQSLVDSSAPWHAEFRVQWPDGSLHWLRMDARVSHDDGAAPRLVGIVADVTATRTAEQAREQAVWLAAENRRVQESSRLKSLFLANMSHELRTPLNSLLILAKLLAVRARGRSRPGLPGGYVTKDRRP